MERERERERESESRRWRRRRRRRKNGSEMWGHIPAKVIHQGCGWIPSNQ